ncbi:methyl-CpG-binding domain protein 3 [Fukomys damarensis]|uniref:methyl-CpG-binding domain protein 3 n=1 Tax=Fukomys damarensis TaxID=885580 RepID=UPI0005402E27|nr:methyl-CpG-binding domain protein 3 [Fukomys damarensis]
MRTMFKNWKRSKPDAEAGGAPRVQGQPGLRSETLLQKNKNKKSWWRNVAGSQPPAKGWICMVNNSERLQRSCGLPRWKNKGGISHFNPSGKKFRSKPQLARYLGGSMDLSTFDFRTGKMLMSKMNKSRQRVRYDSSNQVKGKPDLNTALPVRQTASIFKQPVTKITNHPSNKVKSDPQKAVDQPRQLFWEKKLSGLSAFDIAEELVRTMDLPKGLQGVGPGCTDETLLSAIASALHTSTMPITGQLSAAVEKNPGVWLNTTQPLCKAFMVTDEDIRKQEELVQQVRKRLEEALMADMLAHVEELARDEVPLDKACGDEDEDEDEDEEEEPEPDPELERV